MTQALPPPVPRHLRPGVVPEGGQGEVEAAVSPPVPSRAAASLPTPVGPVDGSDVLHRGSVLRTHRPDQTPAAPSTVLGPALVVAAGTPGGEGTVAAFPSGHHLCWRCGRVAVEVDGDYCNPCVDAIGDELAARMIGAGW